MAQTEISPGSRHAWAADQTVSDRAADDAANEPAPPTAQRTAEEGVTMGTIDSTPRPTTRKPTKFMTDLSRAMQTAVEASRDETIERFRAESKTVVEEIQAASTVEAVTIRQRADDDVAAVREWSKAEIVRIREETETRIAARKTALDGELDAHALIVEARVQRVNATVESYQAEMDEFFERLQAEGDPTRIATMAETMPDPPDLTNVAAAIAATDPGPFEPSRPIVASVTPEPALADVAVADAPEPTGDEIALDAEAAMAARLEFAAAEADALAFTDELEDDGSSEEPFELEVPSRPAPILEGLAQADAGRLRVVSETDRLTTRVVVVGLVSVASIATFKRSLAHADGVLGVGVTSGPDGEFVFTVEHAADLKVAMVVMALPGFEARVTAESAGSLQVTAHDPDTGA